MNNFQEDPRLTAYILGELDDAERAAFEQELESNPDLRAEVEALRAFTLDLGQDLAAESTPQPDPFLAEHVQIPEPQRAGFPAIQWLMAIAAVCVIVAGIALNLQFGSSDTRSPLASADSDITNSPLAMAAPSQRTYASRMRAEAESLRTHIASSRASAAANRAPLALRSRAIDAVEGVPVAEVAAPAIQDLAAADKSAAAPLAVIAMDEAPAPAPTPAIKARDLRTRSASAKAEVPKGSTPAAAGASPAVASAPVPPKAKIAASNAMPSVRGTFVETSKVPVSDALATAALLSAPASFRHWQADVILNGIPDPARTRTDDWIHIFPSGDAGPDYPATIAARAEVIPCPWDNTHLLARIVAKAGDLPAPGRTPRTLALVLPECESLGGEPCKGPHDGALLPENEGMTNALAALLATFDENDRIALLSRGSRTTALIAPLTACTAEGKKALIEAWMLQAPAPAARDRDAIELIDRLFAKDKEAAGLHAWIAYDADAIAARAPAATTPGGIPCSPLPLAMGSPSTLDEARPDATALHISLLRHIAPVAHDVRIRVRFNNTLAKSYRLLGDVQARIPGQPAPADNATLGAGESLVALYEIVPAPAPEAQLPHGQILEVSVESRATQQAAPQNTPCPVTRHVTPASASSECRFTAAMATAALAFGDIPAKGSASAALASQLMAAELNANSDPERLSFQNFIRNQAEKKPPTNR